MKHRRAVQRAQKEYRMPKSLLEPASDASVLEAPLPDAFTYFPDALILADGKAPGSPI